MHSNGECEQNKSLAESSKDCSIVVNVFFVLQLDIATFRELLYSNISILLDQAMKEGLGSSTFTEIFRQIHM